MHGVGKFQGQIFSFKIQNKIKSLITGTLVTVHYERCLSACSSFSYLSRIINMN